MEIARARVLIIATDRFEQSELFGPREMLMDLGAEVTIASIEKREILATVHDEPGATISATATLDEVSPDDFDALILPGGVGNPDRLRMEKRAIELVRGFHAAGKPVAAICHGPWLLVEADIIKGKTVTSWPSIRTDLKNAGGNVVDREVVVDGNIITSRKPDDVEAFTNALIQMLEKARPVAA